MIRLSIGLEALDDILWDIDQALEKAQRMMRYAAQFRGRGWASSSRWRCSRRRSLLHGFVPPIDDRSPYVLSHVGVMTIGVHRSR